MTTRRQRAKQPQGVTETDDKSPDTRERLLNAARAEFASKGMHGARVDEIARRANINKQLIYYHFGAKDRLYLATLEHTYSDIRSSERELHLADLDPVAAMERLVGFTFDYLAQNRDFVLMLTNENLLGAEYLRQSSNIDVIRSPLVELVGETLQRGVAAGRFREGVDPVQLYISIAGLCFFYFANIHTLSTLFDRDLEGPEALQARREHAVAFVLGFLVIEK
jgi:TetR/AcrR family transcriptional regulator